MTKSIEENTCQYHPPVTVTREQIRDDLARLGLAPSEVVFLHSSLKSLGWVEGGPNAVIDAFLEVLGEEGLLVTPTLSWNIAVGENDPAFDPKETPSRVGKISDTLWRRRGAFRSNHPTHSIAALGRRAEELVAGHDQTSTFGKDGPYGRYVNWNAKLVFLGVDLRRNTTMHAIEEWLALPYMQVGQALTKDPDGQRRVVRVSSYPSGHRDFYQPQSKSELLLESKGLVHRGQVGQADTLWVPAPEMVRAVVEGIYDDPILLLCDSKECEFCSMYRQLTKAYIACNRPQV